MTTYNSFANGELVVRQQAVPLGGCPPDVYEFEFSGTGVVELCIQCAAKRYLNGSWMEGMGIFIEDGVCQDCGNA